MLPLRAPLRVLRDCVRKFVSLPVTLAAFASAPLSLNTATAAETETHYLSGRGPADAVPWKFTVTGGRRAGETATIPVPSHWELQGFGSYDYGQVHPKKGDERGFYRTNFKVPAQWEGRRVRLVFGAVMTDTAVKLNGKSAGPIHQGGFTQFSYDVTSLLNFSGDNLLEVEVSKVSADALTERAERGGDYWVFGGIYRAVWLEATPANSIEHVAIDARADGTFTVDVTLGALRDKVRPSGPSIIAESLDAQIFDADKKPVGEKFSAKIPAGGTGRLRLSTRAASPKLWTAETPHLYTVQLTRRRGDEALHTTTTRFGFRTFEVRDGEGLFVNGQRVLLKGVNRHSFRPESGRALDREDCYADARLIRAMNMNAVRMSHYPPDKAFLEACDELGLYVLNELSGWQAAHGTAIGRLLVRELVERDVNHPSIIIWDNGNEGGWNRDLDGDFALYDPQQRPVIHPWDPFGGLDTFHYTSYAEHARRLQGPNLVMPTEILHALYDGGAGAGLHDYWEATRKSKFGAGLFIWDFADEAIVRSDRDGSLDPFSTFAPDGIVGPHFEKEGSYHAVRHVWSPVQIDAPVLDEKFTGALTLHNHYDFTSLAACRIEWSWLRFDGFAQTALANGHSVGPDIAAHTSGELKLNLPANWREADALALTVKDPNGEPLWTWMWATPALAERTNALIPPEKAATASAPKAENAAGRISLTAGKTSATFDAATGSLVTLRAGEKTFALRNGPRLAYARPATAAAVNWLSWREESLPASAPNSALTRFLAMPQTASSIELAFETPRGTPYSGCQIEISADGEKWKTIFDASRRSTDGARYEFPPQRVAAVRVSKLLHADGTPAQVKTLRIGHAAGRFPEEKSTAPTVVTTGTNSDGAWLESRGGLANFRWTLRADETLRLDYDYALSGEFIYHGITFDHDEAAMKSLRWLGEGPNRVWQNRLHGTWLGVHETARHVLQPGESFQYPEFEGYFAGVRRARLETTAGALTIVSAPPETFLRLGTSRISHPNTTVDFPAGDISFLHAIPAMGSKFISAANSGPSGQPAQASGTYRGTLVFFTSELPK
ncbi:glycoside hydrolase family 2 TIM barrel-domain containing protein [Oleiharenicola lentus]|uniref:glycoside hydrolase family 2 protein n=1 Tax=Oleiharenicola lentus TaxID=2508720 RepID=UPI003F6802AE